MIRWIADDKNCEPRKKTSVKSVVRKSQVTGDVCPENIHLRSLLMARPNTHTHTHPDTPSLPRFMTLSTWWPNVRVHEGIYVFEGTSTDEYRRYNSKLSSNIKHLSNWCGQEVEGGGMSRRRDVWGRARAADIRVPRWPPWNGVTSACRDIMFEFGP